VGLANFLGLLPKRPVLLVLNYHRIGNPNDCPYDSGVFSATVDELDQQVRFLKRQFTVVSLDEAIEILDNPGFRHPAVLLTFDDGYRDSYQAAFPVLSAHRTQAAFFLPTSFIGTNRVALWDAVAFIVKHTRKKTVRLASAPLREFDLASEGPEEVAAQLLQFYKRTPGADAERFLSMLEEACDFPRPDNGERLFMNWEEAASMLRGGMAIGSHTHTHPVLSQLEEGDLALELKLSKITLEERLGVKTDALAYPFGLPETLSPAVFRAAEQAGYRAAFSFNGGVNRPGSINRFNILRSAVCPEDASVFSVNTILAAVRPAAPTTA
jgi:peptidoglycan/xylan/chitin deacetylase (PgdA/CDA1 family)